MNAVPPSFRTDPDLSSETSCRWNAVVEAAGVVAALAGVESQGMTPAMRSFPERVARADAWRREQAENGIVDLAAVMEPGIAALLSVNARGADPRPPAKALWREFEAARTAVLSLLPAGGLVEERRAV